MRAAVIENGVVVNVIEVASLDVIEGLVDGAGAAIGDAWDGTQFIPPAPVQAPLSALTQADYVSAIQAMLDAKATERKYFGIISACTYGDSTNATFKAEAQACIAWRDAVWAKAYDVLAQVQAGTLAQPTVAAMLAMLPTMTWPT
jgi:hypothetical protein